MRAKRLGLAEAAVRESKAVILFWVGPYRIGIDARALKEIRNERDLAPKQLGGAVILSAHALLGVPPGSGERVLVLRHGRVAIRVDRVERMVEASAVRPLPRAFQGAERAWYSGFAMAGDAVVPLLNPEVLEQKSQPPVPQRLPDSGAPQSTASEGASS
jgi:chemotaxis signal transduction protein